MDRERKLLYAVQSCVLRHVVNTMNEILLSTVENIQEDTGETIFLYDPVTNSDLTGNGHTSTLTGGAVASTSFLINGHPTLALPTVAAKQIITFATPLNLNDTNWTFEWSSMCNTAPADYANDVIMDSNEANGGIYTRYGNSGYVHRFYLSDSRGTSNTGFTQPTQYSKAALKDQVVNWALVQAEGIIRLYKDGSPVSMALGASGTNYNQPTFPPTNMNAIYRMRLGDANGSTVRASPGYRGRMRLSLFARYRRAYIVKPLDLE